MIALSLRIVLHKAARRWDYSNQNAPKRWAQNKCGTITLRTEEIFGGLLPPIFGRNPADLTDIFRTFAAGFKKEAEKGRVTKK